MEWLLLTSAVKGVIFMQKKSMEQKIQFEILDVYFESKQHKRIADFFRTETICDEELLPGEDCYTFFQEVHAYNVESSFVNFTFIYVPPIDKNMYGIEDVLDILEEKQKEETFVLEISMQKTEVTEIRLGTMVAFANHLGMSMYMSVADYKWVKRTTDYLFGVSSIILDLDTYNTIHEYDTDEEMFKEMMPVFDRIGMEPNMYINSGHGRYLVFSFNNVNLSIPEMQKLYKETVKKLFFHFKEFGADNKCSDITRIFRVPGNINPKTGNTAYMIECFGHRTTISKLADAVGICKGKSVSEKKKKNKNRTFHMYYKPIGNSRYTKVNEQRDEDFHTLLELRKYDMEGHRNILFHLMAVNCFYLGMDEQTVKNYLDEVNGMLFSPYDGLDAVIRYAKRNYETYEDDYEGAIKYKNRTIVDLLDITEEEQKHMKQLISQKEADKRIEESAKKKVEKQKEKKRQTIKELNQQLEKTLLELRYCKLLDNKQLAEQCKVDERTVTKMIGLTPKFVTVGRVDIKQAVYIYYLKHMSNIQIAEQLNISVRTVKRRKKQLRSEGYVIEI